MVLPLAFTSLSEMGISLAAKSAEPAVICLIPSPDPSGRYLTWIWGVRLEYASPHAVYSGAGIEEPQPTNEMACCAGRTSVRDTINSQTSIELPIRFFFTGRFLLVVTGRRLEWPMKLAGSRTELGCWLDSDTGMVLTSPCLAWNPKCGHHRRRGEGEKDNDSNRFVAVDARQRPFVI